MWFPIRHKKNSSFIPSFPTALTHFESLTKWWWWIDVVSLSKLTCKQIVTTTDAIDVLPFAEGARMWFSIRYNQKKKEKSLVYSFLSELWNSEFSDQMTVIGAWTAKPPVSIPEVECDSQSDTNKHKKVLSFIPFCPNHSLNLKLWISLTKWWWSAPEQRNCWFLFFFFRTVGPLPTFYIKKKISHFKEKTGSNLTMLS